mgnify:CR=1 FL=1
MIQNLGHVAALTLMKTTAGGTTSTFKIQRKPMKSIWVIVVISKSIIMIPSVRIIDNLIKKE